MDGKHRLAQLLKRRDYLRGRACSVEQFAQFREERSGGAALGLSAPRSAGAGEEAVEKVLRGLMRRAAVQQLLLEGEVIGPGALAREARTGAQNARGTAIGTQSVAWW